MGEYFVKALSLQVGANELERRVVWYQPRSYRSACVQIAPIELYEKDGRFTDGNSSIIKASLTEIYQNKDFVSCKARIPDLIAGNKYIYRVGCEDIFDSKSYVFSVEADASKRQSFFLVGDMHINVYRRSPECDTTYINDRWQYLLSRANQFESDHKPSYLLSVGDNISVCNMQNFAYPERKTPKGVQEYAEAETAEFLAPHEMKEIAFATVLGNHDALLQGENSDFGLSGILGYHYDMPNDDGFSGHYLDNTSGNFYFSSGDLLVVGLTVIDPAEITANNKESCSYEVHRAFVEKAVASHPDAKWKIILNHVPEYSYIAYYSASNGEDIKNKFSEIIDGLGFDIVFSGHQHAFSRTHAINGSLVVGAEACDRITDDNGYKIETLTNPRGVIHYNIPSAHDHAFYQRPYKEEPEKLFGSYGITPAAFEDMKVKHPDEAEKFKGILYSSPMYTYVSMREGEMRIMTVRSDKNVAVDTLVIRK